jgi:hypothetical protein
MLCIKTLYLFKGHPERQKGYLELELQKHLAKIILETQFEFNVTQTCINKVMSHFDAFLNSSITKIMVSYLRMLLLFLLQICNHFSLNY